MEMQELIKKVDKLQSDIDKIKKQILRSNQNNTIKEQIERVTDIVEIQYNLPRRSIYKHTRKREISEARQVAMILIHCYIGMEPNSTVNVFKLDPSSLSYAKKAIHNLIETKGSTYRNFTEICRKLKINKKDVDIILTNLTK